MPDLARASWRRERDSRCKIAVGCSAWIRSQSMLWRDESVPHTIIPAFAQRGDTRMSFGIMGGWNQAQAHAQFISDIADFKMNIQAAMEAPRFVKYTFTGCDVSLENRFSAGARKELAGWGHKVEIVGMYSSKGGGGQVVLRDFAAGVDYGGCDPRKDGAAVTELPE